MMWAIVIGLLVICLLLAVAGTGLIAVGVRGRRLPESSDVTTPRSPLWLVGGIGLLLVAIVFGMTSVITVSQAPHWQAQALVAAGEKALLSNDFDKAIAECTEAIRIDPSLAVAFNDRGAAWLSKNDYDKAIADCDEALRLKPTLANAFVNRGQAWVEKEEYDKALEDCNEAIRLKPKVATAFNNRGLAWLGKGEFDKAIADCSEALRLNPTLARTFSNRALAWMGKLDYDKGLADCNESLRLDPWSGNALNNRGFAWNRKGEYGKAAADWEAAIRVDPTYAVAYNSLAWLKATCPDPHFRDGKEAVKLAMKACKLTGWRDPAHLATLAAADAETGDFDNAVKWLQKAIELAPDRPTSEPRLALAQFKAHKPLREPDVRDLADCVWTFADMQTSQNLLTLMTSFKASRVGVGIPPDGQAIPPARQHLEGGLKWIAVSTTPDGKRCLVVLADVKNLAEHEPRSRFAEVAGSDVIQLAIKEQSGIVIQILTPGKAAYATLPQELVQRLGAATPRGE